MLETACRLNPQYLRPLANLLPKYDPLSYDSNGNCKGTPEFTPPTPTRIAWDLGDAACLQAIDNAHIAAEKLLNVSVSFSFWPS